jgi:hypothetical protein
MPDHLPPGDSYNLEYCQQREQYPGHPAPPLLLEEIYMTLNKNPILHVTLQKFISLIWHWDLIFITFLTLQLDLLGTFIKFTLNMSDI